jgi:urease accessory protein
MALAMTATTAETEAAAVLAAWFSPGYPVGAFAYSHGLEWAIGAGDVRDRATLVDWVATVLAHGAARSDAILLAAAFRDPEDAAVAALATALQPSAERRRETLAQGAAFAAVTAAAWPAPGLSPEPAPYPVAVGRAARAHGLPLGPTLAFFLQAFAAALVSAAVRLVPLGHTDGQRALAALVPLCAAVAAEAEAAGLDDLGGCALRSDLASLRHETQEPRLFRS